MEMVLQGGMGDLGILHGGSRDVVLLSLCMFRQVGLITALLSRYLSDMRAPVIGCVLMRRDECSVICIDMTVGGKCLYSRRT